MAVTLDQLVERVDRDYRAASGTLDFLPTFIDPNAPDTVNVEFATGSRPVPTLKKLTAAIDQVIMQSSMNSMRERIDQLDTLSHGMVSALSRLGSKDGPSWSSYDLTSNEAASDMTDPMFRANVEDGVRFPFDAYIVVNMQRRNATDWAMINNTLLPQHTDVAVPSYSGAAGSVAQSPVNASQYPAFSKTVTRYAYNYYQQYYGGYYTYAYRWVYRYEGWPYYTWRYVYEPYTYYWVPGYYYTYYTVSSYTETVTSSLAGSQVAQTFRVDEPTVLKGIRLWSSTAGSGLTSPPSLLITESSYGMPDTGKVIGTATVVNDSAYSAGQGSTASALTDTAYVSFNLDEPIYLQPGKSYSFVVNVPGGASYNLYTTANAFTKGGVFYTQDGAMWTQDLAKDLLFTLVRASFTAGTQYVELNPLSVSGGIASIKSELSAIVPENCDFSLEVDINGVWREIDILNDLDQLPPYTPVRAKVVATEKAAPLINTVKSRITAFRSANSMRFTAKKRPIGEPGVIRVSVSTMGYEPYNAQTLSGFHNITFTAKCDGESTVYTPTLVRPVYGSNKSAQFEVIFNVPVGKTEYQLAISGSTTLATRVFDVTSIVEI